MKGFRKEFDSHGSILVPNNHLWGAQTQRSLVHFSIGKDLMPKEMIAAFAVVKKAAAIVNHFNGKLKKENMQLISHICDELLEGKHKEEFPLRVWMTGSGTQFNMNVNEVISNRASQMKGKKLGSHKPLHPNDHVNMAQSSNDSFPSAMQIAAAVSVTQNLIPTMKKLAKSISKKAASWKNLVKVGRTHLQDATPITLGQEFSGYAALIEEGIDQIKKALDLVFLIPLGGTAVGTGLNTQKGYDTIIAKEIAKITKLPFKTARNKFAAQGCHNSLVILSGAIKALAVSLYKIGNDIRLLSCGPRAGFQEIYLPDNEPGSSMMPGKVNPTQCEALCMVAVQVISHDFAVSLGGASGYLEMNVYKPLMIYNLLHSVEILTDSCANFDRFLVQGMEPNRKQIEADLKKSLMLVTALSPTIGYEKASDVAQYAFKHDLTLKEAAMKLKVVTEEEFDRLVNPLKMCYPN